MTAWERVFAVNLYRDVLRPLIFSGLRADPETVKVGLLRALEWLDATQATGILALLERLFCYRDPRLEVRLWGLTFPNPIGLAAGFDKDGLAVGVWPSLGFGFVEVGTVTPGPQPGNPKPRLFQLPQDRAALNHMGFNNQGAAALAERLRRLRQRPIPIGINLGKGKATPLEEAAADYLASFRLLRELGDYFVVNVSSPNTAGLRSLQADEQLAPILATLQGENRGQKPLLVKIAPDLDWPEIDAILELAQAYRLAGLVATNTTLRRDNLKTRFLPGLGPLAAAAGGISGAPLRQRSTQVIRYIHQATQGQLPIIGVGGIFTLADAMEKLEAGASLLQVYTGWVYEGPSLVPRLLRGLAAARNPAPSSPERMPTGIQSGRKIVMDP
ncbi:diguanylate cyclase [Synechococcus sp. 60AY4M2]|nr:diguanylate cyclase [Synechococcus sp. 65AY6A5]PIK95524.1 diguanylate cyclase [Synechococcus sp. 60AY4M2]PIK97768.1 diguanylate cyclase [Synechococcus sp. 63AY4M1]PIL01508.1 diguanylate cyclase [Synechococcus sp. 65AY640]